MRTQVIDCEVLAALQKDGHEPIADLERSAFPLRYSADFRDSNELAGHQQT